MELSNRLPRLVLAVAVLAPAAACDTPVSATSLNPAGPPMITQVFMDEPDATGRIEHVLAFGTYPDVPEALPHAVTHASATQRPMRAIVSFQSLT